ncbi:Slx4p interacting protein [Bonamia ostreae]|uniref:Slx4p interacting protein n=1 Tax=Bonamia ostreae TaxID=126728 RepID=A0ABV2APG1_9EUKA
MDKLIPKCPPPHIKITESSLEELCRKFATQVESRLIDLDEYFASNELNGITVKPTDRPGKEGFNLKCKFCEPENGMDSSKILTFCENCHLIAHATCFALKLLKEDDFQIIPSDGKCPDCGEDVKWAEMAKNAMLSKSIKKFFTKIQQNFEQIFSRRERRKDRGRKF